jgi:hypothetical protein
MYHTENKQHRFAQIAKKSRNARAQFLSPPISLRREISPALRLETLSAGRQEMGRFLKVIAPLLTASGLKTEVIEPKQLDPV